jgi:hypothetical protein
MLYIEGGLQLKICAFIVGDGVKCRPRRIIPQHVELTMNTGESEGSYYYESLYITNYVLSAEISTNVSVH